MNGNRIGRKDAQGMQELVSQYIREMKLASGYNRQRVVLVRKMNEYLDNDELLVRDAKAGPVVRELILR